MPTITAKDFAEGAPIPTDQVEKDILILENKIAQYKKFGFLEKEEKQVEILKSYKGAVKGKSWPTAKQAMNACKHPQWSTYTTATGVKMAMCTACSKTWHAPLDTQPNSMQDKLVNYYNSTLVKNLKANTLVTGKKNPLLVVHPYTTEGEKPKDLAFRIGKSEVDQKFIMRMGMLSNCNVSVARIAGGGYLTESVLSCSKCKDTMKLTDSLLVAKENALASKIEEFCVAHKHDAKVTDREGRHFRVED